MRLLALILLAVPLSAGEPVTDRVQRQSLQFERQLDAANWNNRIHAVHQLGELGSAGQKGLTRALQDADWQVRFTAVHWLGRNGLRSAEALASVLRDEPCRLVRVSAVHWLGSFGPQAAPLLERALSDESTASRIANRYWLRKHGRFEGEPADGEQDLAEDLNKCQSSYWPNPTTKGPAPPQGDCLIVDVDNTAAVCPTGFREMSRGKDSLTCCRKPERKKISTRKKEQGTAGMPEREIALAALAARRKKESLARPKGIPKRPKQPTPPPPEPTPRIPDKQRISELDAILHEQGLLRPQGPAQRNNKLRHTSAQRVQVTKQDPSVSLESNLALGDSEVALPSPQGAGVRIDEPISATGDIEADHGSPAYHNALPGLLLALRAPEATERARAADELGAMGSKAATAAKALTKALRDNHARVRASAALALGNIGSTANHTVRQLQRALKDKHPSVRYSAAESLGRINTPRARKAFEKYLRREFKRSVRETQQ